ncbi:MAG: hypothetical protein GWN30_21300 [Gammaproteobacteria bacterium]|nr:hypothetical protein [Gammaproteobacteria bacterium]
MAISSPDGDVTMGMERVDTGKDLISPSSGYTDWVGTIPVTGAYQLIISTNNPDTYYFLMLEIPANIFFETGATSETISGYVEVFQDFHPDVITRVRYMAYAREDQTMEISLGSPNLDSLAIGVIGQSDGKEYINYEVKSNHFEMDLPSTQGYFIDIYSVGGVSTDFSLQVEIE